MVERQPPRASGRCAWPDQRTAANRATTPSPRSGTLAPAEPRRARARRWTTTPGDLVEGGGGQPLGRSPRPAGRSRPSVRARKEAFGGDADDRLVAITRRFEPVAPKPDPGRKN